LDQLKFAVQSLDTVASLRQLYWIQLPWKV